MSRLADRIRKIEQWATSKRERVDRSKYAMDPVGYCRDVLHVRLTPQQEQVGLLLLRPPHRVLVRAGHSVGKTFLAACLASWWYDTRSDGCVLATAPTRRQVEGLLFAELRALRPGDPDFAPAAPWLGRDQQHFVQGFTARDANAFQGFHRSRTLLIFDEAVGVPAPFWLAGDSLLAGGHETAWLAICNPTDPTSAAGDADRSGKFASVTISCTDHPNIAAELNGLPPLYPTAVRIQWLLDRLDEWATPLAQGEPSRPGDVTLAGKRWRPGPAAEARLLGRWPSGSISAVVSEALWSMIESTNHELKPQWPVQIGCDVARFGDDFTAIHVRQGLCALHHESHNGWDTKQIASRLKELAYQFRGTLAPQHVPVLVDVCGVGAGVVDQRDGYSFIPVNSSSESQDQEKYGGLRSGLWFSTVELAREGLIDISRLPQHVRQEIGRQLQSPLYSLDLRGRLVVERKEITKKRLKRSPDDADAFNLAWWPYQRPMEVVS